MAIVDGFSSVPFPVVTMDEAPRPVLHRPDGAGVQRSTSAEGGASQAPAPRLRVARIITRLNVGGPARHVLLLADGLSARGFDTTLLTGEPSAEEPELIPPGLERTPGGAPIVRVPGLGKRVAPVDDVRALAHLVLALRRLRPDIVHTHTSKAGALGRLAAAITGVPVVVHTFHGHVLTDYFPALPSALVRLAERALARVTQRVITLSPGLARDLVHRFHIAPAERVHVVPLGRDLSALRAAPRGLLRRELALPEGAFVVGAFGRLVPIKRVPLLVAAFARLARVEPAARLVIAGDGPERPAVEAAARERGLEDRVHLLGWRDDLPALYGDLDLLALSSKNEGTPLAIVEAFAAGVPVVATRVGGVADMFGPATGPAVAGVEPRPEGAVVPPEDEGALGEALVALARDPARRMAAGRAARAAAGAWDADRLCDDLARLYRELAPARRP